MILRWHNDFWMLWVFSRVLTTDNGIIKRPHIARATTKLLKIQLPSELLRELGTRRKLASRFLS
jgi:hypothetical protein